MHPHIHAIAQIQKPLIRHTEQVIYFIFLGFFLLNSDPSICFQISVEQAQKFEWIIIIGRKIHTQISIVSKSKWIYLRHIELVYFTQIGKTMDRDQIYWVPGFFGLVKKVVGKKRSWRVLFSICALSPRYCR